MAALLARHSSRHSLAVFCRAAPAVGALRPVVRGACAVGEVAAGPDGRVAAVLPVHSAIYALSVLPLACMAALLARHSSRHCLAVFCCAMLEPAASMETITAQHMIPNDRFMFGLRIVMKVDIREAAALRCRRPRR